MKIQLILGTQVPSTSRARMRAVAATCITALQIIIVYTYRIPVYYTAVYTAVYLGTYHGTRVRTLVRRLLATLAY